MLKVILLFIIINLAVLFGGLEGWLGWDLGPVVSFVLLFVKVFLLLGLGALMMTFFEIEEAPLLLVGLVFGILIIFGNSYYGDFQKAFYQKQNIGGALEIDASELVQHKDLYKTPYIKINTTAIGEIKTFKRNVGKPDMQNIIEYCYVEIPDIQQPVVIITYCSEDDEELLTLREMQGQEQIVVEVLSKKVYFPEVDGLQFTTTEKTFDAYYQKQFKKFLNFIMIVNSLGIVFVLGAWFLEMRQE